MKWLLLFFPLWLFADEMKKDGLFSGRVVTAHEEAGLIRVHVEFENLKYLNKKNIVEFWKNNDTEKRCKARVVGKSNTYMLLKVYKYDYCARQLFIERGAYVKFYSEDLVSNIKTGRELMEILLKKRLGIKGQLEEAKKNLDNYMTKVDTVNKRYEVLIMKLTMEQKKEISYLDEDKNTTFSRYKELETRLDEVEHKLQQYQVSDENLNQDRWSLDSKLYYRK
jgi:tetrahydromethanopterin S-methyltransferase subunit G